MWEIIRAGGGFMWPIILCSIASVAIILERLWTLQSNRVIPRDLAQKVWNWIEADQMSDKLVAALEQNSPLGKLLAIGLANRNKPRAMMVERLEDGGRHVVHELERFLEYARHDRGGRAAARTARNRRRHHPCVQCDHGQRPRRSADSVRRHRRSAHHDRGGTDGGDSLADRLSLPARQGRAAGHSHGKGSHEARRCAGRARRWSGGAER